MILDRIDNADFYAALHPQLAKAFDVLKNGKLGRKKAGKYEIDGDKVYYSILRYETKPMSEGKLEAHKKYIDIQVVLKGEEVLGYADIKGLAVAEKYDKTKDIAFFEQPAKMTTAVLKPGHFCILFPQDAHLPCCCSEKPADVKKVVIKVRLV
jgi:biofilm protein TabA